MALLASVGVTTLASTIKSRAAVEPCAHAVRQLDATAYHESTATCATVPVQVK